LGRQIHELLQQNQAVEKPVFFDDNMHKAGEPGSHPFAAFEKDEFKDLSFIIGVGYKHLSAKNDISRKLKALNRTVLSFIHPSCFVNETAEIKAGSVLYPMCNIDQRAVIGHSVLINNSVVICHDSVIGDCTYISPGVVIAGKVTVGENCFIGAGAVIANGITVGNNVIIGIGTVITQDVPGNSRVIGNPMRMVESLNLF